MGYISSIEDFERFLQVQGIKGFEDVTYPDVRIFLTEAHEKGLTRRTISKKISALRSFYKFFIKGKMVKENPFLLVSLPKQDKRIPKFYMKKNLKNCLRFRT